MNPDKGHLLAQIRGSGRPGAGEADAQALVRQAEAREDVRVWYGELAPLLPETESAELRDFLRVALVGVCVGFIERHLSPEVEAHRAIVPPLLEDIRSVHAQLRTLQSPYDHDEFRYRAFDYGIHKAYYLDWQLYMSREPY